MNKNETEFDDEVADTGVSRTLKPVTKRYVYAAWMTLQNLGVFAASIMAILGIYQYITEADVRRAALRANSVIAMAHCREVMSHSRIPSNEQVIPGDFTLISDKHVNAVCLEIEKDFEAIAYYDLAKSQDAFEEFVEEYNRGLEVLKSKDARDEPKLAAQ